MQRAHLRERQLLNCPPLRFPEFKDEWQQTTLGELLEFFPANSFSWDKLTYSTGNIYNVHYGLIHKGLPIICSPTFLRLPYIGEEMDTEECSFCKSGDLVIADASEDTYDVGKAIELVDCDKVKVLAGLHTIHARSSMDKTVIGFKGYLFASNNLREQIKRVAQGTKVYSISSKLISPLRLSLPSLSEQKKIASFLSLLDERIEAQRQTIKERKNQKKALLSQIFSQALRFPGFSDEWQQTTLGEVAEKVTEKNKNFVVAKVYSNSALLGIIEQTDFFDKEIANQNNLREYYIVKPLYFIYNPRISSLAPVGAMNLNKQTEVGLVSPLYTVFRIKANIVTPYFLEHLFRSNVWHPYMKQIGNYGARDDRMNIKDADFFSLPISLPSLEEQKKIAELFTIFDERIEVEETLLACYERQKRYLLRQMFV